MDRLPLELKTLLVETIVWGCPAALKKDEKWEDGPVRLLLPDFHPLHAYLYPRRIREKPTEAQKALIALQRTSKVFQHICDGIIQQVRYCSLERKYTSDDASDDGYSIELDPPATKTTRVMNLLSDRDYDEEIGTWIELPTPIMNAMSLCEGLSALAVAAEMFDWLPDILDALPDQGARLQQLEFSCREDVTLSQHTMSPVELALARCSSLNTLLATTTDYGTATATCAGRPVC